MSIHTQTSRGDLLRWLQRCQTHDEKCLSATILGYEWCAPVTIGHEIDYKVPRPEPPKIDPNPAPTPAKLALKRPQALFYALASQEHYADPQQLGDSLPPVLQGVEPLSDADLQPFASGEPLPHQAIVPEARMRDFLRQSISHSLGQRLDIPQLVKRIARLQTLYHLPRKPRVVPAGRVYVVLDLNKRLLPFWLDAHRLCESIVRQYGLNGLEIRVIDDDPQGEYWDWFDQQQRLKQWQALTAQSVVFIVSDLGQLAEQHSPIRSRWDSFFRQLSRKNTAPVVLAPVSAVQQQPERLKTIRQVLWHKHGKLKPEKIDPDIKAHAEHVRKVLALLSVAVHVEPELLRALLRCLPAEQADSGIEAAVYQHADMQWGYTAISMRPEKRAEYQAEFKQLDAGLQYQVLSLLKRQHIGQFPAIWAEEIINALPLVSFPLEQLADVQQAEAFMQRFAKTLQGAQSDSGMTQFARRHLNRLSGEAIRLNNHRYTSALYGLAYREQLRAGAPLPAEYDAAIVHELTRERTELNRYGIWQVGEALSIAYADTRPVAIGGAKLAELDAIHDSIMLFKSWVENGRIRVDKKLLRLPDHGESCIVGQLDGQILDFDTGLASLTFAAFTKPSWADSIVRNSEGLSANLRFAGKDYRFGLQAGEGFNPYIELQRFSEAEPLSEKWGEQFVNTSLLNQEDRRMLLTQVRWEPEKPRSWPVGVDQYGLYADLTVNQVTQRFRWIEPGSFMMGSGRGSINYASEAAHAVTLTKGFWLADSAVTQAFWLAVMGGANPSYFQDNQNNPVEQVSWDDAQSFIASLNALQPSLGARLPSEAEWELACRAGTTAQFAFGDYITPSQVNYDGRSQYVGGEEGLYRGKTVPVKSLPANPWGLYEMHGNLWEWCEDVWQYDLGSVNTVDPLVESNQDSDGRRVQRGGSWCDPDSHGRSAARAGGRPGDRDLDVGFRLAIGHAELKPGPVNGEVKSANGGDSSKPGSGVAE
ncbi:formylglycine-generating enzyme family protein [Methylomonas sp. ZR1]|uniref:formylglycine-generating enzyme family protein n=1 Tax=Methylomonas sp. ZR1 TaxID=1797072 RepID=UPI001492840A|nr:formylglycine-generating enzyme family protein [Methylomonas sp. ZR1]NOV29043.1 formylglycine-generating enzyme family protein [Methylomonas sp. ZR1]